MKHRNENTTEVFSFKLQSPKAMNKYAVAGLLTYSRLSCLPIRQGEQWLKEWITVTGEYSSGSVQDSHLIPF